MCKEHGQTHTNEGENRQTPVRTNRRWQQPRIKVIPCEIWSSDSGTAEDSSVLGRYAVSGGKYQSERRNTPEDLDLRRTTRYQLRKDIKRR